MASIYLGHEKWAQKTKGIDMLFLFLQEQSHISYPLPYAHSGFRYFVVKEKAIGNTGFIYEPHITDGLSCNISG